MTDPRPPFWQRWAFASSGRRWLLVAALLAAMLAIGLAVELP